MESRWRRGGDELCHRCLSAAAVWSTVGLRIRSIIGSRGECAALTRRCAGRAGVGSAGERKKQRFRVYKSCWDGAEEEEAMYSTRPHTNTH